MSEQSSRCDVAVVGAGVAGLAAATALAGTGATVALLERRAFVGGRAYSYPHPALGEVVDSQHVLVGCCTNLIDLCASAGLAESIRWYDTQIWLEPGRNGRTPRRNTISVASLPTPLHYAPSFLGAAMLDPADKLAVARGLAGLVGGAPGDDQESVAQWYVRTRQTPGAIAHLWEPLVLATLNQPATDCSMAYAAKVFYELFLKNSAGGRLGIPIVPLSDLYGGVAARLEAAGTEIHLRSGIDELIQQPDGSWLLRSAGWGEQSREWRAKNVILALPFEQTQRLITTMSLLDAGAERERGRLLADLAHFSHSPFISILLWYDRQITDLDHAWLLDSTIQWFFHKSRIRGYPAEQGSYIELVIAGSGAALAMSREQLLAVVQRELASFFPEAARSQVRKSAVLKEARATFSLAPGNAGFRPAQRTAVPGLYLAGDWTATEWPSTMEGAARSGRLAAGEVVGERNRFLAAELLATGLMRLLSRV